MNKSTLIEKLVGGFFGCTCLLMVLFVVGIVVGLWYFIPAAGNWVIEVIELIKG